MRRTLIALILSIAASHFAASLRGQPQLLRPPITGITLVRLWSVDPHAALGFYSKTLGFIPRDAGCPAMVRPCYILSDHQQLALAEGAPGSHTNLLAEVAFATPDAGGMHRYLEAHNIPVNPVTRDFNGTIHFSLQDPEGLPITFVQAPAHRQFTPPANQIGTRLIHAGFVVLDRAAEDKFYKDILGFHVYWHGGMKDDESNWVDMQVPDGTDWLEYMLNVPANADKHTLGVMNHIAVGVPDIHAAEQQLRTNGWSGTEQPKIGRDGKWQLNLYDPDGTRVELMEFTPVQKPCCSDYTGPHPKP
jgi:catechol 2,3-dioxygenase-like lactoylglutathione lyase family enzyme